MSRRKHSSYKRYNRKEYIRSRRILIILLSIVVVLVAAATTIFLVHRKNSQETVYYSGLEECTLPVLTMNYHDRIINRLFGYTAEMDLQYIRDSIYILDSGYDMGIMFEMYGNTAKALEFSVYDLDANNRIQTTQVQDYKVTDDNNLSAVLRIDNIIEPDEEYSVDIKLTDINNREIHYYTRIMYNTTSPVQEMMAMALEHHDAMYDKSKTEYLIQFQAPNSAVNDSTNFGDISLSSTLNSMYWGTMGVRVLTEPVITIVDVDTELAFFRLKYQVGRLNDNDVMEYYNVSEYYRTRMYEDKKYILSYERTVNQLFVPDVSQIGNKSVLIGILQDLDIQTMTNPAGNMNVFVADKAVWFIDTQSKVLQKVFSFETSPLDIRQNNDQHAIKLLKITDEGDFQFIVYGYMNRGMHEGQAGIGLYTYSADKNEVREDVFIPSYLPFQMLKNSIGNLCYLNNSGILYIMLDEFVYALDSHANKATLFVSGLNENNFKSSAAGRMLAWQDGGESNTAVRINVVDLENETSYYVTAQEGRNIKVLGFLDNDLVYGEGDSGHTYFTADGEEYLLMDDLYVVNNNNVIQTSEHSSRGYYVTSVVEYNRVVINRVARVGSEFKKGDEFTLFSTSLENYPTASTYNIYDEDRRTINYVEVVNRMEPNKPAVINDTMKITLSSEENADVGDMISDNGKYYVYAAGEIIDILTNPADAIMRAYYATGVAVTSEGYFYRRSSRPITMELSNQSIDRAIENYRSGELLNITGIYLNQALYYTGRKVPVIWERYQDVYAICGYDLFDNLMLKNIDTGEEILVEYDEVDDIFDESGRCFIDLKEGISE
ncbi:MAG: hypothetical protein IKG67_14865 [Parasporobacterium sp.]|nr:hypothetical protein [Parasporobacterium sp.]